MPHLSSLKSFLPASIKSTVIRFSDPEREQFMCPICGYAGPFQHSQTQPVRRHVFCGRCGSLERHRLMWLVLQSFAERHHLSVMRALHFAPERCLRKRIASLFNRCETADISGKNVDHKADMCNLPFPDTSFDVVIACHVLHHIRDEASALSEIRRVLRVGGMAILPVAVFSDTTVEYPEPVGTYMRAAGRDYFDRCRSVFSSVQVYSSVDFDQRYQ